jgi:1-acyl-sn-glycerol-3-phosphate acyltransferase
MFYQGLKLFMKLVLRVFFRKIYFSGAAQIPADKPVILACNHPNSFLDAVLLAVLLPRPLHFLARSDVFNSPFKRWLLTRLHLIPVYRLEEGPENLHRNEETFTRCYGILENNGAVLIFSEGLCVLEKRLRPLRKGTARLAFGAAARHHFNLEVQVVPVGINYTHPDKFRQEVMMEVRPPITVRSFEALYRSNPARAMQQFNQVLRQELEKSIISIQFKEQEEPTEALLRLNRAGCPDFLSSSWFSTSRYRLETEQAIARLFPLPKTPALNPAEIPVQNIPPVSHGYRFLITLPIVLLALAPQVVPLWLAVFITRKKVRQQQFYASVLMVVGMVLYLVYWLCLSAWLILAGGWLGLAFSLLLPCLGFLALLWMDKYRLWKLRKEAFHRLMHYPVKPQRLEQPIG